MNLNKRDCNGWVLCPSQRFAGKFYFFNIYTGDAAWSPNELEKRAPTSRTEIQRAEKWNSYPEPNSPPVDEPNAISWQMKKPFNWPRQAPIFGQGFFPSVPSMITNYGPSIASSSSSFLPNEPYPNMAWGPQMIDWPRNYEPNAPFWSPECDLPMPKRMIKYESPRVQDYDMTKNWFQPTLNRPVFGFKQQNFSNDRQNFSNDPNNRNFQSRRIFQPDFNDGSFTKVIQQEPQPQKNPFIRESSNQNLFQNFNTKRTIFNRSANDSAFTKVRTHFEPQRTIFGQQETMDDFNRGPNHCFRGPNDSMRGPNNSFRGPNPNESFTRVRTRSEPQRNNFGQQETIDDFNCGPNDSTFTRVSRTEPQRPNFGQQETIDDFNRGPNDSFTRVRNHSEPQRNHFNQQETKDDFRGPNNSAFTRVSRTDSQRPNFGQQATKDNFNRCPNDSFTRIRTHSEPQRNNFGQQETIDDFRGPNGSGFTRVNRTLSEPQRSNFKPQETSVEDFEEYTPQKRNVSIFGNYQNEKRLSTSKTISNLTSEDHYNMKMGQKAFKFPNTGDIRKDAFTQSLENLSLSKETSNVFLTPQMLPNTNRRLNGNFSSQENVSSIKDKTKPTQNFIPRTKTQIDIAQKFPDKTVMKDLMSPIKRKVQIEEKNASEVDNAGDLREFLIAKKKRKLVENNDGRNQNGGKKIKTHYTEERRSKEATKKRVSFNLDVEENDDGVAYEDFEEYKETTKENEEQSTIKTLRDLAETTDGLWYIAVDSDVLLDDYEFIEQLVLSDDNCCVLVPYSVKYEIDALCVGDCRGRARILAARNLSRRLAAPPRYIKVQASVEEPSQQPANPILECCLLTMEAGYHVVLITNSEVLYEKAIANDIYAFSLREIKDGLVSKPEVSFVKEQTCDENQNFYYEVANDSDPYVVGNSDQNPVNSRTKNMEGRNAFLGNHDTCFFDEDRETTSDIRTEIMNLNISERNQHYKNLAENQNRNSQFEIQNYNRRKQNGGSTDLEAKEMSQSFIREFKGINIYTIVTHMKKFAVTSEFIEERITTRIDEWICCFSQIMEDVASEILRNNVLSVSSPPLTVQEVVECLRELYGDNPAVKISTDSMTTLLFANTDMKGKMNLSISATEFMKLLGCSFYLIKSLKNIMNKCPEVAEAYDNLEHLVRCIEQPSTDLEPIHWLQTPVVSRIDLCGPSHRLNFVKSKSDILDYLDKHFSDWQHQDNSKKSLDGSKKDDKKIEQTKKPIIIRTFGGKLNLLKLNKKKNISTINIDNTECESKIKRKEQKESLEVPKETGAKLIKTLALNSLNLPPKMKEIDIEKREKTNKDMLEMINTMVTPKTITRYYDIKSILVDENADPNIIEQINSDIQNEKQKSLSPILPKGRAKPDKVKTKATENVANTNVTKTSEKPEESKLKTMNKPELVEEFNKKHNNDNKDKETYDLDVLDYSDMEIESSIHDLKIYENEALSDSVETNSVARKQVTSTSNGKINENTAPNNDVTSPNNEDTSPNNEDSSPNNNDSSPIENGVDSTQKNEKSMEFDSLQAYRLVKAFLAELSNTFKIIYAFIEATSQEMRASEVPDNRKQLLHNKADKTHRLVAVIIDKLKVIIARESSESSSLKAMISKNGGQPITDKRVTRYKQVVMKCLEQAQILQHSLKAMISIIDDVTAMPSSIEANIQYVNIFEDK